MVQKEFRGDAPLGGVERKTSRLLAEALTNALGDSRAFTQLTNVPQTEADIARVLGMRDWGQLQRAFEELGETPGGQESIMLIYDGLNAVSRRPVALGRRMRITTPRYFEFIERLKTMCTLNHPDLTWAHSQPPLTCDKFHQGYDPSNMAAKHKALEDDSPSKRITLCDEFAAEGRFYEILPLTRLLGDNREGGGEQANKVVSERAARAIEHISWSIRGSLDHLREEELNPLLESLNSRNPVVRRHLTYALGYFPVSKHDEQKVKTALEKVLQDRDPEVQEAAKKAMETRSRRQ